MKLPFFNLPKPHLSEEEKGEAVSIISHLPKDFSDFYKKINSPQYLYWTEARSKARLSSLSDKQAWFIARILRNLSGEQTIIKTKEGHFFQWTRTSHTDQYLQYIDTHTHEGGHIFTNRLAQGQHQNLIYRGIMEEAIASSQLEGAHTTRSIAKKMIIEKRKPRDESEQMILNNYHAMMNIEEKI